MGGEPRWRWPLVLAFGSPVLAAAVTVAVALIARGLPPVRLIGLNHGMDGRVVCMNAVLAFVGAAAGGLMTRGGPFRRSAVAVAAGGCAVGLYFALLLGVFLATWSD